MNIKRKPRLGLLLLGCDRFRELGSGSAEGSYHDRCLRQAESIVGQLSSAMEIVYDGIVYDREQAMRAIHGFQVKRADMVVTMFLSWTPDGAWNLFLREMSDIPILYAHVVKEVCLGDTNEDGEFVNFLCNASLVATLECSGDNARYHRAMFFSVNGTWEQVLDSIRTVSAAAVARSMLKEAHFGLMDCYNEVMWSTYVDPYSLFMKVGPELHFLSMAEWQKMIDDVPLATARQYADALTEQYETYGKVDKAKFIASIRATLGMEQQARAHGLDVLVYNDVDITMLKHIGLRPGFYPLSPPEERCLTVPEGDVGSGIALYVLTILGNAAVNYMEPFYIDQQQDAIMAGHAGPNDYTDPRGKMIVAPDVRFAKTPYRYAGAPFAWYVFPEGRKTLLHCSEKNGRFQFVAAEVDFLPCQHFLASYCHGLFRPVNTSCEAFIAQLTDIGVTQHYLSVDGNQLKKIKALAKMLDFDYIQL